MLHNGCKIICRVINPGYVFFLSVYTSREEHEGDKREGMEIIKSRKRFKLVYDHLCSVSFLLVQEYCVGTVSHLVVSKKTTWILHHQQIPLFVR